MLPFTGLEVPHLPQPGPWKRGQAKYTKGQGDKTPKLLAFSSALTQESQANPLSWVSSLVRR